MDTAKSLLNAYNKAAKVYSDTFYDDIKRKTFDQEQLKQFGNSVPDGARVYDLGCGPGFVTDFLHKFGLDAVGIDLSEKMVKQAAQNHPSIQFQVGDMMALDINDESAYGITAFYSIIHTSPEKVSGIFEEMYRILKPKGVLLFSCHFGEGAAETENWFGMDLKYHCYLYKPDQLKIILGRIGFTDFKAQLRDPYDFEHQTKRIYVTACK